MDVDDSEKCFRTIKFTVFEKILIKVQKMPVFCKSKRENPKIKVTDTSILKDWSCLLYTSPSPRDRSLSRMPSSA